MIYDGTCILVDLNNLSFRTLFVKEVGVNTPAPNYAFWRYLVFDSIYHLIIKIREANEVILAVDDKNSWRRSYFPRYKESRKLKRDKSDIDWESVFKEMHLFVRELKHYMPFKVLKVPSAEADDIIGVLTEVLEKQCVVSSNDEDYLQLCSQKVKVWNPSRKEFSECPDTDEFLTKKCLTGQPKDDIFNVITPNDWGITPLTKGKRKPGFGEKSAEKVLKEGLDDWLKNKKTYKKFDVKVNPKENFRRNRVLIDFKMIPETMRMRILKAYDLSSLLPPVDNMYKFFKKYGMTGFIDEYSKVENIMLRLYR